MSTFFVSISTIFKLMYFNWRYFSFFRIFRLFHLCEILKIGLGFRLGLGLGLRKILPIQIQSLKIALGDMKKVENSCPRSRINRLNYVTVSCLFVRLGCA